MQKLSLLKKVLIGLGVFLALLIGFIGVRILLHDQKEEARRLEAQQQDIPLEMAQKVDLEGACQGDFLVLAEPGDPQPAPSPTQWRALLAGIQKGTTLPVLLPEQSPLTSEKLGTVRYAVQADSYQVRVDCRSTLPEAEKNNCGAVTIAVTTLAEENRAVAQKVMDLLVREPVVDYLSTRGQGTDGLDKPIRADNRILLYNEFCSEIGCNASVAFLANNLEVKVEGTGNLEPWFTSLARQAASLGR